MRRILGCILALFGLAGVAVGISYILTPTGDATCTGGDPYGIGCSAGNAALDAALDLIGITWLVASLALGVIPGVLLAAWPRRRASTPPPAATPA